MTAEPAPPLRVKVDPAKCDGFGNCVTHCPEVFSLDEWGFAQVEKGGIVPLGSEHLARRAVIDCPVHAIIELG